MTTLLKARPADTSMNLPARMATTGAVSGAAGPTCSARLDTGNTEQNRQIASSFVNMDIPRSCFPLETRRAAYLVARLLYKRSTISEPACIGAAAVYRMGCCGRQWHDRIRLVGIALCAQSRGLRGGKGAGNQGERRRPGLAGPGLPGS